jgi:peptide/nickel transport system ATP-binding protein
VDSIKSNGFDKRNAFLAIDKLTKCYELKTGIFESFRRRKAAVIHAVDEVSLSLRKGEIVGVAGESGSGKTTLGELILRLQEPTSGKIYFDNIDTSQIKRKKLREFRKKVQMVFQDPYETLNPRFTVLSTVSEPLKINDSGDEDERIRRTIEVLELCELKPAKDFLYRYPHELSGGQRQRVSISRAIVLGPELVVADEPVSMLDFSIRAGVLNLLKKLKEELGLTVLYISHDLATINYICDRTMIMYLGKIVEGGDTFKIMSSPLHPYTQGLIACVPKMDIDQSRAKIDIPDEIMSFSTSSEGCRFQPRCSKAKAICESIDPDLKSYEDAHAVACHLYNENT